MNRIVLLLMLLVASLPVAASHTWSEIDLCEVYKDKLPPGLTLDALPESGSGGAELLDKYCTQCHNLPGPDRHTASEWREVTSKMFMLMDVSNRFGGLMGRVEVMQPEDQETLLTYLEHHGTGSIIENGSADNEVIGPWLTRSFALLPFVVLVVLGLLRWGRRLRMGH
ncbi:MAG: hypothetical protein ABW120_07430 [Sedimenticola sp.]